MEPKRLGNERARRTEAWAAVCASLFGANGADADEADDPQRDDARR